MRTDGRESHPQSDGQRLPEVLHLPAFGVHSGWVTRFHIDGAAAGGAADLTRDERFGGWLGTGVQLAGKRVLELGPLEGAHTAMLCRHGAREVVAVEGRAENFVKCCIVKNVLSLQAATFVLEDITNVTRDVYGAFDVVLASGVLYHVDDPAVLIARLVDLAPIALIWTHIATEDYPRGRTAKLVAGDRVYRGKWYREPVTPLAGLGRRSFWPYLSDLRRMLADGGFAHVDEIDVDLEHSQGAAWLGTAWRDGRVHAKAAGS